jgi:hypothetical protein
MTMAETQVELGLAKLRLPIDPVRARKHGFCDKCAKKGVKSKLELVKDGYTQMQYTKYKFEIWACHVCKHLDKRYFRIEGKGKMGANSGKMWGGI